MNRTSHNPTQQQGAALAVSLVILLLMTLIAVTSMQTTTMEEKMAGNSRDRNLAFQSAESALRQAETWLEGFANTSEFGDGEGDGGTTTIGLYDEDNNALHTDSTTWTNDKSIQADAVPGTKTQPRYYMRHYGCIGGTTGSLNIGGHGAAQSTGDTQIFKITARGTGRTDNAVVMLRSNYGKEFGSCS